MIFLYGEAVTPAIVMHVGGYYWVECHASLVTSLTSDYMGLIVRLGNAQIDDMITFVLFNLRQQLSQSFLNGGFSFWVPFHLNWP
jgi:hypothetical protein